MPVFIAISVFLPLIMATCGGAIRPVVTFTPNWGNILQGDSVTLTCDVISTIPEEPRSYQWYKNNRLIHKDQQNLQLRPSRVEYSGDYQCRVSGSDISDPVTLNVTNSHLILQRPPSDIYEGDPLTLRCYHISGYAAESATFYKDNQEIKSGFSDFHIDKMDLNSAGHYKCSKKTAPPGTFIYHQHSDEFSLSVKELFSIPRIKLASSWVIEGDEMTVRCDTRLDPRRANTELQFAFYKDRRPVQEFSVSDKYRVRSAQLEDSGDYACKVRTATDTVRKMSDELDIQIHNRAVFITILLVAIVGGLLIIALSTALIWRCKNKKEPSASSQGSPQETPTMVTDPNPDEQDVCYTYLELSHLPKGNTVKDDDLMVTYATVQKPSL